MMSGTRAWSLAPLLGSQELSGPLLLLLPRLLALPRQLSLRGVLSLGEHGFRHRQLRIPGIFLRRRPRSGPVLVRNHGIHANRGRGTRVLCSLLGGTLLRTGGEPNQTLIHSSFCH